MKKSVDMKKDASVEIEKIWNLTVKTRAMCPYAGDSLVGYSGYQSPQWYRERGAIYFVNHGKPLTPSDIQELRQIGEFVNRSFIIAMATILETFGIVPYRDDPDRSMEGGGHVQLLKWLRNRFAHGEWIYDNTIAKHVETRNLLEKLFPEETKKGEGFVISIDKILEPLKDEVLKYIRVCP